MHCTLNDCPAGGSLLLYIVDCRVSAADAADATGVLLPGACARGPPRLILHRALRTMHQMPRQR